MYLERKTATASSWLLTPRRKARWHRRLSVGVALVALACRSDQRGEPAADPSGYSLAATPPDEDGSDLWLRYRPVVAPDRLAEYSAQLTHQVRIGHSVEVGSEALRVAESELQRGLAGLLGKSVALRDRPGPGAVLVGTPRSSPFIANLQLVERLRPLGDEGFLIVRAQIAGASATVIAANTPIGAVYGSFAFLRHLQLAKPLGDLELEEAPRIDRRLLNHWDNLDRSVERGYAGPSLWDWEALPGTLSDRYVDYARATASLGINGTVLTNVNANAQVLTPTYLKKVAALANLFRPYGIRVYLTARFSAPIEIGGLATADPLADDVAAWWDATADTIYQHIPDFGGFLVKANSEGQPGPQDYGRNHADGANMLADALAPHGGIVMWRAFVYNSDPDGDRIRQAYDEFQPLDGSFRANVAVQAKNGPLDFQPREPFHPLFGAMPNTPVALELQITKEYLGQDTHLAYLGPLYEEVLQADTYAKGPGSLLSNVVDGSLHGHKLSVIAGVANIGSDRNWSGSHFNQANWYAYGRMAWNPQLSAEGVATEWAGLTLSNKPSVVETASSMMMASHEAIVNYTGPLGIAHAMATEHHYGPGPWVKDLDRPEWNPFYYHRASHEGIGFDRTASGSGAVSQYFPPLDDRYSNVSTTPEKYLLFFHRQRWTDKLSSGRTLWDELVHRYSQGVDSVRGMRQKWASLRGQVDNRRFLEIEEFLEIQEHEAKWWRDASLQYFGQFSGAPIAPEYEQPAFPLGFYTELDCPANRDKPRCPEVYLD